MIIQILQIKLSETSARYCEHCTVREYRLSGTQMREMKVQGSGEADSWFQQGKPYERLFSLKWISNQPPALEHCAESLTYLL